MTSLSRLAGLSSLLAIATTGFACSASDREFRGESAGAGQTAGASGSAGRESKGGSPAGGHAGDSAAGNANEGGSAGKANEGGSSGKANEGGAGATGGSSGDGGTNPGGSGGNAGSGIAGAGAGGTSAGAGGTSAGAGGTSAGAGGTTAGAGGTTAGAGGSGGSGSGMHWVGTWTASPYLADSTAQPPSSLTNAVLRQVTHVSLGGNSIRVQFSNLSGDGPVTIKTAHVALCNSSTTANASINVSTDKALAFAGQVGVTIAKGAEVWSDPIDFAMPALSNVSITTAFGSVPAALTAHAGSRTTSYLVANSTNVSAADLTGTSQSTDHWYYISGIDVMADAAAKGLVAIGDSITDGRGTDTNKNNRWTDILAARLKNNAATANVAVMNQGIGGTALVGSGGTAAQARFARDVLGQSGVKYAIVLDGVNDIGGNTSFATMKAAYDSLISAAHNKGVLIFGGTITPFGANSYYSVAHESVRAQVNAYIKSGVFDGYIDFDTAVSDGGNPPKLQTVYATWAQTDGLHPGPAGYQKMGDTPDLTLFTK